MKFTNQFHVQLPVEETWELLTNIPRIMPCLPGATLKEMRDENHYLGSILIRLGPIKLSFDGNAEFVRKDKTQYIAWLKGSGLDPKGRGSAESEFSFALKASPTGGTDVTVETDLQLSGAVAQYGRGSGMIAEVAGHILKQFEENLADSLQYDASNFQFSQTPTLTASPLSQSQHSPDADNATRSYLTTPISAADVQGMLQQSQAILAQAQALLASTQQMLLESRKIPSQAKKHKELNMLSIGFKALWAQIKRPFTHK